MRLRAQGAAVPVPGAGGGFAGTSGAEPTAGGDVGASANLHARRTRGTLAPHARTRGGGGVGVGGDVLLRVFVFSRRSIPLPSPSPPFSPFDHLSLSSRLVQLLLHQVASRFVAWKTFLLQERSLCSAMNLMKQQGELFLVFTI